MNAPIVHQIRDQTFWLSPHRLLYWEETASLVVSDLHIGKTGHFRKSGIAVPQQVFKEDMQRLVDAIMQFKPQQLIIVGDLFHSHHNKELDLFCKWRNDLSQLKMILVKGNHDILPDQWYADADIDVTDSYHCAGFSFRHDPDPVSTDTEAYLISGHLHPGILLKGMGKQSLRFPCFYFTESQAILPAFSKFSGLANIEPGKRDTVYAIVNETLVKFP